MSGDRPSKIVLDKDGKVIKLFQQDSFLWNNEDPNYKNLEYFDKLAFSGNNVHEDEEWGTDPCEIYDENYPSNKKGVIMTIHELDVILHVWKYLY